MNSYGALADDWTQSRPDDGTLLCGGFPILAYGTERPRSVDRQPVASRSGVRLFYRSLTVGGLGGRLRPLDETDVAGCAPL